MADHRWARSIKHQLIASLFHHFLARSISRSDALVRSSDSKLKWTPSTVSTWWLSHLRSDDDQTCLANTVFTIKRKLFTRIRSVWGVLSWRKFHPEQYETTKSARVHENCWFGAVDDVHLSIKCVFNEHCSFHKNFHNHLYEACRTWWTLQLATVRLNF